MSKIRELIRDLAKSNEMVYSEFAKVISVNETNRTCVVKSVVSGVEYVDCLLQALEGKTNGMVIIPEINSMVLVSHVSNELTFVSLQTEIKQIKIDCDDVLFNGGTNGGLVNIEILKTALDTLQNEINILKAGTASGFTALAAIDGGASSAAFNAGSIIPQINISTIEDSKIKH